MTVGRIDIKSGEFVHIDQGVGQPGLETGIQQTDGLLANLEPAFAAQGGEEVIEVRGILQMQSRFLQKAPPASRLMENSQDSKGEPIPVGQHRAFPRCLQISKDCGKRSKKMFGHRATAPGQSLDKRGIGEGRSVGIYGRISHEKFSAPSTAKCQLIYAERPFFFAFAPREWFFDTRKTEVMAGRSAPKDYA